MSSGKVVQDAMPAERQLRPYDDIKGDVDDFIRRLQEKCDKTLDEAE
jgi:hypothetical protein